MKTRSWIVVTCLAAAIGHYQDRLLFSPLARHQRNAPNRIDWNLLGNHAPLRIKATMLSAPRPGARPKVDLPYLKAHVVHYRAIDTAWAAVRYGPNFTDTAFLPIVVLNDTGNAVQLRGRHKLRVSLEPPRPALTQNRAVYVSGDVICLEIGDNYLRIADGRTGFTGFIPRYTADGQEVAIP